MFKKSRKMFSFSGIPSSYIVKQSPLPYSYETVNRQGAIISCFGGAVKLFGRNVLSLHDARCLFSSLIVWWQQPKR